MQGKHANAFKINLFGLVLGLILLHIQAFPQVRLHQSIEQVAGAIATHQQSLPLEKLYLHFDRPVYATGDTIWFKAYLLNDYLLPSNKSGLLYVEVVNSTGKIISQTQQLVATGIAFGNIALDEKLYPEGIYTLRAYTNWMRNFDESYIFKKDFYIVESGSTSLLVGDKKNASFTRKKVVSEKVIGAGDADLQFMPEGGNLVAGLTSNVAFKAIGGDGKAVAVEGHVFDHNNLEVASFKSLHAGMGNFGFLPQPNEIYTVKTVLPGGRAKSFPFPTTKQAGTVLMARTDMRSDSLIIIAQFTPDLKPINSTYYLIGYSRGIVCYAANFNYNEDGIKVKISKTLFPTGIAHFVLLNQSYQPLNERLVYVNRYDSLNISLQTDKPFYAPKDSIGLNISIKDEQGKPATGSFSLAVTDDGLVKADTNGTNILTHMLLNSDLKGYIENPNYYLKKENQFALDLLLLTQGWVGYDWVKMTQPAPVPHFAAEPEFAIKGKVGNVFNKAVAGVPVTLLSNKPMILMQTTTSADGRFIFKGFPRLDTAIFQLQVRRKNGNSNNVGIEADEFVVPVFTQNLQQRGFLEIDTDTANINITRKMAVRQENLKLPQNARQLKEVQVKAKKTVKGSHNLNGDGNADYVLNEQDMIAAKKMTLEEILKQKIKGFAISGVPGSNIPENDYMIFQKRVHLIIDGINADRGFAPVSSDDSPIKIQDEHLHYTQTYMGYYTAEDIKGVEVLYEMNLPYASTFGTENATKQINPLEVVGAQHLEAYIEVTTRSGHGPMMSKTPGTYLYKPLPFAWPKQFYRPRYTVKTTEAGLEPRPTIHWEPNVMTDAAGKVTISFYSASKPGSYTLILQGTDLNGKLGYFHQQIIVK